MTRREQKTLSGGTKWTTSYSNITVTPTENNKGIICEVVETKLLISVREPVGSKNLMRIKKKAVKYIKYR